MSANGTMYKSSKAYFGTWQAVGIQMGTKGLIL